VPPHAPLVHTSFAVQVTPSLQAVPLPTGENCEVLEAGSQASHVLAPFVVPEATQAPAM
jgi:hypothetical protein